MQKKTYLKSAVYVLLLPAVCVIPFALAQRNASKRSVAAGGHRHCRWSSIQPVPP